MACGWASTVIRIESFIAGRGSCPCFETLTEGRFSFENRTWFSAWNVDILTSLSWIHTLPRTRVIKVAFAVTVIASAGLFIAGVFRTDWPHPCGVHQASCTA